MKVTDKTVRELADLACLELTPDESQRMQRDLEAILDYVAQLDELDTEGVPATAHVLDVATPLREDVVRDVLPREEALRNGPRHDEESVVVPRVIE